VVDLNKVFNKNRGIPRF